MTDHDDFNEAELFSQEAISAPPPQRSMPMSQQAANPFAPPSSHDVAGSANPLAGYFRMSGTAVTLPSGGRYYKNTEYFPTATGEVSILPMRAADEILLSSPDALMNGQAVEGMLKSCVPAITDPRNIVLPDLEVLLLSIRAASYGDEMDVTLVCPECEAQMESVVSLAELLSTMVPMPDDTSVTLPSGLRVMVSPSKLSTTVAISRKVFEQTRLLQAAMESGDEEEGTRVRDLVHAEFTKLTTDSVIDCILSIVMPDGNEVTKKEHIREFLINAAVNDTGPINDAIEKCNTGYGINRSIPVQCAACNHEWETEVELDPANFFARRS